VRRERDILAQVDHLFLPKLFYSFSHGDYYFMVLEYVPRGTITHFVNQHYVRFLSFPPSPSVCLNVWRAYCNSNNHPNPIIPVIE
jgi:serine/threonine protein kinase